MVVVSTTLKIVFWVYILCIPLALYFTYQQEKMDMKIKDAPNRVLGLIYHFLTVWFITPLFILKVLKYLNK